MCILLLTKVNKSINSKAIQAKQTQCSIPQISSLSEAKCKLNSIPQLLCIQPKVLKLKGSICKYFWLLRIDQGKLANYGSKHNKFILDFIFTLSVITLHHCSLQTNYEKLKKSSKKTTGKFCHFTHIEHLVFILKHAW